METEKRFIDSGWRVTIPKTMRERLGWHIDTIVCVHWDGFELTICNPRAGCVKCPDITRIGALGKVVIPPEVREEARLYPGQILSLSLQGKKIIVMPEDKQLRCSACGSEFDVKKILDNVHLCRTCREDLEKVVLRKTHESQNNTAYRNNENLG
jgi:bifunctional DNA-binding transcriptional regulator/antitoxin component of YhaV-PrlF toxin-antitoxin module